NVTACLYAMNFKASATAEDIIYGYGFVLKKMHYCCNYTGPLFYYDIAEEQHKVEQAELVIFQFPLYWFSIPADKKAILSFTNGGTESMFQPDGIHGDFNVALWPLQNGVLRFCGFQVLASRSSGVQHSPPDVRNAMLDAWQERLNSVFAEKPLSFAPTKHFDLTFQG
uniref:NAD(P)H dehydrogenase, quinone 1 n=1 Tax=Sinocyclocheilus grahami TaxID=75366 RepID=A0A672KS54_SINGR